MKFIENAVRFDQQSNAVYVKNKMDVNDVKGAELCTVLKAMDVSLSFVLFIYYHVVHITLLMLVVTLV